MSTCLLILAARAAADPAVVGQWTAPIPWPIIAMHTILLPNGKLLVWPRNQDGQARIWEPETGTFTAVPIPGTDLFCAGFAYLGNGKLLVAGGHNGRDGDGLSHAHLFDASTSRWTRLPDMNAGRWYPTACTLGNGDVVVVSGNMSIETGINRLPQVFGLGGSWRDLPGALFSLPMYPFLHLAPDGRVFNSGPNVTAYYLDTAGAGSMTPVAVSHFGFRDAGTSVMYDIGKVLIVGGHDPPTATAEVIDLRAPSPAFRPVAPMAFPRRHLNATLLPDGKVLVTGGTRNRGWNDASGSVLAAEAWDPVSETWTTWASHSVWRTYHSTAILLPDGRVMSGGGGQPPGSGGDVDHYDIEIFSPPYLFRGPRPTLATAPLAVRYGQTFAVGTPDASSVASVTWLRLGAVTHSFNMNQRFMRLAFTRGVDRLTVTAPAHANLSPPGHYLLFLLNGAGVPSVGRIVHIGDTPLPPTQLRATAASSTRIDLSWQDHSNNEDGFKIERSLDNAYWRQIAVTAPNVTTFVNTGLAAGTLYYYRVRAYNEFGNSARSNIASATTF